MARQIRAVRPHLRTSPLPFSVAGTAIELLWPATADDDEAGRHLRGHVVRIAKMVGR